MTFSGAEKLLRLEAYGFWTRTKNAPYRAVQWEPQTHEDGRQSFRGRNWVEVLPHDDGGESKRFLTSEVETVGPNEWLDYYPSTDSMICGWEWWDKPGAYCPRKREVVEPFCPKHMIELNEERNLSGED